MSVTRNTIRFLLAGTLLAVGSTSAWYIVQRSALAETDDSLIWTIAPSSLRITVTERGTLESQKTVNGVCEIEGRENKIIFIVEEGLTVKEGDVVVRFDASGIDKEIAEERLEVAQAAGNVETKKQELEVQRNTGVSEVAAAQLELTLADLDLEKYEKGDHLVTLSDLKGKIALAKVEKEKAEDALKNTRELLKKGFREPEQVRVAEQEVERATFNLSRDERQLDVLINYEHRRKLTELQEKANEAKRKLERSKSTAAANLRKAESALSGAEAELKIQEEDLAEQLRQKGRCEIVAKQSGVVAYANEEWWSESRRIREGSTVYERQIVFFIPDMSLMQVKVKVHESEVKRIAAGQRAIIRVDAFANQSFTGTVKSVSQLSKSDGYFGGGVKEYTTIVVLDEPAKVALRPGMTAEVEILVDSLVNVLAVPVQAIAENRDKQFVYVREEERFRKVPVEVGQTNNRLIVVTSGVSAGDVVALDARTRAAEESSDDGIVEDSDQLKELADEFKTDSLSDNTSTDAGQSASGKSETTAETPSVTMVPE